MNSQNRSAFGGVFGSVSHFDDLRLDLISNSQNRKLAEQFPPKYFSLKSNERFVYKVLIKLKQTKPARNVSENNFSKYLFLFSIRRENTSLKSL